MLGPGVRNAGGAGHFRQIHRLLLQRHLDAALDVADRLKVFVQLAAVAGAEPRFQFLDARRDGIQAALIRLAALRGGDRVDLAAFAEKPLEDAARIGLERQGSCRALDRTRLPNALLFSVASSSEANWVSLPSACAATWSTEMPT